MATTLHLFETSYTDFFKECIDYTTEKQSEGKWEGKNYRWVEDSKNKIVSIHHFSNKKDFAAAHKDFSKKWLKE